jgi:hypothetical protein
MCLNVGERNLVAKLITRGFGTHSTIVAQGMGGPWQAIIVLAQRVRRVGQSGTKRALREIEQATVWVKLVAVNGINVLRDIVGAQTLNFVPEKRVLVKSIDVKKSLDDVKVIIISNGRNHT